MIAVLLTLLAVAYVVYVIRSFEQGEQELPNKFKSQMNKLWKHAHVNMRENRFVRAEKALLAILKIDNTNAAAYNRLGVLYAKQKEYKDAIDCFEIASSIQPTASSLHNLGLIYYETENYEKAVSAFERALEFDDTLAARHIAVAKALQQTGNQKLMQSHLEKAAELEPNKESYGLLIDYYRSVEMHKEADLLEHKIKRVISKRADNSKKRIKRPTRRIVV
jgi:tetratricopeptide (TPR) repeat protein